MTPIADKIYIALRDATLLDEMTTRASGKGLLANRVRMNFTIWKRCFR